MELSRRDLLLKSLAIGVIKLSPEVTTASAVESWLRAEGGVRPATPTDQLGPFYPFTAKNINSVHDKSARKCMLKLSSQIPLQAF